VYILDPATVAIDLRVLSIFLAIWRRRAGHVILIDLSLNIIVYRMLNIRNISAINKRI